MFYLDTLHFQVDSNEMAFKLASVNAFRTVRALFNENHPHTLAQPLNVPFLLLVLQAFAEARPNVLEPVMDVEVVVPSEFQGVGISILNKRKGQLTGSESGELGVTIEAIVPLSAMFGFSTELRSSTQGKGEYSMLVVGRE
jgi:elongation factor G